MVERSAATSSFRAVDRSFNCISVEGHASTNDTVLLLSSTAATEPILRGDELAAFAGMVRTPRNSSPVRSPTTAKGATHFITIDVTGCASFDDARSIARAVADSPLVKTAIHGADPNWGRIVSAAGYAGVSFPEEDLSLCDQRGTRLRGWGARHRSTPNALSKSLKDNRNVQLRLRLKSGGRVRPLLDLRPDG